MAQITYADKVALNVNPEIAAINKVQDTDMNEIKKVVNENYNNTIQITNTEPTDSDWKIWIDTGEVQNSGSELPMVYPVGSIYMSVNNTNPAILFGFGTWEQIKDTFLLSAGSTYTAGDTGGEATHTLTVNEMPSHVHDARTATYNGAWSGNSGNMLNRRLNAYFEDNQYKSFSYDARSNIAHIERVTTGDTSETGGGQAFSTMPPYLVVYMWKRTA